MVIGCGGMGRDARGDARGVLDLMLFVVLLWVCE